MNEIKQNNETAGRGLLSRYVTTEEVGEVLLLVLLGAIRRYGTLVPQILFFCFPVENKSMVGINYEYENWQALMKYARIGNQDRGSVIVIGKLEIAEEGERYAGYMKR